MRLDPFTSVLIAVVALASFFPCEGQVAVWFGLLTKLAVALLFFMHGAKLSRQNLLAGLGHWRLHLVVMASTFVLFPLLGLLLTPLVPLWLSPAIYLGFLYLCALPATVQSAIAFTSMAGGNVSAAVCSASASSILGISAFFKIVVAQSCFKQPLSAPARVSRAAPDLASRHR